MPRSTLKGVRPDLYELEVESVFTLEVGRSKGADKSRVRKVYYKNGDYRTGKVIRVGRWSKWRHFK